MPKYSFESYILASYEPSQKTLTRSSRQATFGRLFERMAELVPNSRNRLLLAASEWYELKDIKGIIGDKVATRVVASSSPQSMAIDLMLADLKPHDDYFGPEYARPHVVDQSTEGSVFRIQGIADVRYVDGCITDDMVSHVAARAGELVQVIEKARANKTPGVRIG